MSYEKPEDKWKREKQYQAPTPGQPKPPANSPADEAYWMQEKQGRVGAQPNQPQNPQDDTYAQGLLQYQSEMYSQAVGTIKPLYDESQLQTDGSHYRNTADILYDSYLKQDDKVFNATNAEALAQARNFYSLALAVDAPNKDEANSKLQQVTAALKLLSATPKK